MCEASLSHCTVTLHACTCQSQGIITLNPIPEPRDIRPSATAIAGGDDGWLYMQDAVDVGSVSGGAGGGGVGLLTRPVPRVNVNNRLVPEDTVLNDGDLVILTREKVKI
jgi:hypothetical protein